MLVAVHPLLLWLGSLFVPGLATLFSTFSSDLIRPLAAAVVVSVLVGLPSFFLGWAEWSLTSYWANLPAYLGQSFPLKELLVSLLAAVIPIAIAVPLFKRQQY